VKGALIYGTNGKMGMRGINTEEAAQARPPLCEIE